MRASLSILYILIFLLGKSQTFPPAAGIIGSTAIYKDSLIFVDWAKQCAVKRGYQDLSNVNLGFVSAGDESLACGKALNNGVVSLGDAGEAICTFNQKIYDGPGFDFAVFENSFDGKFLELAFVEVSSDGINFFRFPASTLVDTIIQTDSYGNTDPSKINNLAGKYIAGYGTPFDLQELSGIPGLDIQAISHIKIIDVVGSVQSGFSSRDAEGRKVNDPWPTPFPQGGFDLDGIGVIHSAKATSIVKEIDLKSIKVFPNPAEAGTRLKLESTEEITFWKIYDAAGNMVLAGENQNEIFLNVPAGFYYLKTNSALHSKKIIVYSSL